MRYTVPPELERRAVPRTKSFVDRFDRERALLAALGGTVAALAWLATGALTDFGKLPALLVPGTLVAAILGALLVLTPVRRLLWAGAAVVIGAFYVVTMTPFVSSVLAPKSLVRADPRPKQELDAIVVLSGGITQDSLLMPEPLDRLLTGLALMHQGAARMLVVTEPRRPDDGATAERDQRWLSELIDRPFEMLEVDSVHTTHDEAAGAWRLLQPRGATRIAVVTSPLHTFRACSTFERVGFTVTCLPAIFRGYAVDGPRSAIDRLALFRDWLYERAALLEYRERGWLATGSRR
jgi:uncharacterized SAM-binding protein YcdF (DUF218 family)